MAVGFRKNVKDKVRCMSKNEKSFPEGMVPIGGDTFNFAYHPGVSCFTKCCRDLQLFLYPYDVIRLKNRLGLDSETFLERYAAVGRGSNPYFPSVVLRMREDAEKRCPFLDENGCSIYEDRPSACRTYPLERAVDRTASRGTGEFYFMTDHPYCKGHAEERSWTVKEWLTDQKLVHFNMMDNLWAEMDTLFLDNPWGVEGAGGPKQLVSFMACYNVDAFRSYCREKGIFTQFKMSKSDARALESDDEALLRFAYKWLQFILAGRPTLRMRKGRG